MVLFSCQKSDTVEKEEWISLFNGHDLLGFPNENYGMRNSGFFGDEFIAGGYIDKKLCDEIIQLHKTWRHRCHSGPVGNQNRSFVDKKTKDSLDLNLNKYPGMMTKYNLELAKIVKLYRKKYNQRVMPSFKELSQ